MCGHGPRLAHMRSEAGVSPSFLGYLGTRVLPNNLISYLLSYLISYPDLIASVHRILYHDLRPYNIKSSPARREGSGGRRVREATRVVTSLCQRAIRQGNALIYNRTVEYAAVPGERGHSDKTRCVRRVGDTQRVPLVRPLAAPSHRPLTRGVRRCGTRRRASPGAWPPPASAWAGAAGGSSAAAARSRRPRRRRAPWPRLQP